MECTDDGKEYERGGVKGRTASAFVFMKIFLTQRSREYILRRKDELREFVEPSEVKLRDLPAM